MKKVLLLPLLAVSLTVQPATGLVRHVKQDAPGNNAGTSWIDAYRDLRTALNAAVAGDHVWIAAGIYYADYDPATNTRTGDRSLRFPLKSQLTVLGGFAGTETTASQRDWRANRTILNGEAGVRGSRTDNTLTIMGSASLVTGVVIEPLFDFSTSPEPPGTVTLTIEDGLTSYTIGTPASAVLKIYDSPAAQWSAETGLAADAAGLAAFALGNSLSVTPGMDSCMMVSALLNPIARDVAVTWKLSEDLA